MNAVVVYESHWGNTEAIANAIAAGLGPEARALTTDEAFGAAIGDAELIVAGAPVITFRLASDATREGIASEAAKAPTPPDLSHPSMRSWLDRLEIGHGHYAAFETRMRWSPGGAIGSLEHGLHEAGFQPLAKGQRFVVTGKYGPLRDGELERARQWGSELAQTLVNAPQQGHH